MTDLREHAFTLKGFLTAHAAPPEMLAGIQQIIDALATEQITINARIPVELPGGIGELTRRFIEKRATSSFPSSNDVEKQEVTTLQAVENIKRNSPIIPDQEQNGVKGVEKVEKAPIGNISRELAEFVTDQTEKKKSREWTPERKAAQAEIMRARHAAGKAGRKGQRQARTAENPAAGDDDPPEEEPAPVFAAVKKTDMLGEPLIDIPAPWESAARKPIHDEYVGRREDGTLRPGDLVDIYDMLGKGKTTDSIAEHYCCEKKVLEAFILKHKNAQITKYDPVRFTGDTVSKPSSRGGGSRY